MPKPRKAAIYARVSSEKQGRDSAVSIGEQVADCRKLAEANGDSVVAVHIDDSRYRSASSGRMVEPSAKRPDRPEWVKLLAGAGREWEVLYSWRTDRICRGNETAGMFERVLDERRFDVVLVTQTFDRDSFGLLAGGIGGYELRGINVRLVMGREARIKNGLMNGRAPLGYRALRSEQGRNIGFELTDEGRALLGEAARLFLAGEPLHAIGRQVGRNSKGHAHSTSAVTRWLTSPFYRGSLAYGRERPAGQVVYNERPVQHALPWDAATIAAIDRELERRRMTGRSRPRRRVHDHLLAGVLHCGYCGLPLSKHVKRKADGTYSYYYYCNAQRQASADCPPNQISELAAVRQLRAEWRAITPATVDAYLDDAYGAAQAAAPLAAVAARAELDQLEAEAAELEGDRANASAASARLIDRRLTELRADIAARSTAAATRAAEQAVISRATMRDFMLRLAHLDGQWEQLSRPEQHAALATYPAVYVKHGLLVAAPASL